MSKCVCRMLCNICGTWRTRLSSSTSGYPSKFNAKKNLSRQHIFCSTLAVWLKICVPHNNSWHKTSNINKAIHKPLACSTVRLNAQPAKDLRLLSSGPRCGLSEINLPPKALAQWGITVRSKAQCLSWLCTALWTLNRFEFLIIALIINYIYNVATGQNLGTLVDPSKSTQ